MQLGEDVAEAQFKDPNSCPFEPHQAKDYFTSKAINVKSVRQLRRALEEGKSTRCWEQGSDDIVKKTTAIHDDSLKKAYPKLEEPIQISKNKFSLSIAAHHLIPGEASLPESTIANYIWKSKGIICGDIGYDVDGAENGVWLPTHQLMSRALGKSQTVVILDDEDSESAGGMSWEELSERAKEREGIATTDTELFIRRYTQQAMQRTNAQFHDAHPEYSSYVIDRLNDVATAIATKIENNRVCDKCSEIEEENEKKKPPPYMLVFRLNRISRFMENFLVGKPSRWWRKVYTSKYAEMYSRNPLQDDQLEG